MKPLAYREPTGGSSPGCIMQLNNACKNVVLSQAPRHAEAQAQSKGSSSIASRHMTYTTAITTRL